MVSPWMPCTPLRVCTPSQASQFGLALSLTSSALFQGQRILGDLTFTHTHPMHPRMPCTPLRVRASSPASQFWLAPSLMSSATNDFFNGPNILVNFIFYGKSSAVNAIFSKLLSHFKICMSAWKVSDKWNSNLRLPHGSKLCEQ